MFRYRFRILSAAAAFGMAAASVAVATVPAAASVHPPPASRHSEGPAGPPARMPDGRVATPPRVPPLIVSSGCQSAPYGANYYAPGTGKTVALTFDDGPGAGTTPGLMSVLQSQGVTATFFNIGQNMAAQPSLVRAENDWGYMIGNHTWDHPDMTTLSAARQATEMDQATAEQQSLIGSGPCAFRPPYGSYNSTTLSLAQQRRMKDWQWSVDTEDWKAAGSSAQYWVDRIISLAESEGGGLQHPVILMHNAPSGDPATVKALPTIISYFRSHGYTFVNLLGNTGTGYQLLTSNGGVHNFGAPWWGSAAGTLPTGVTAVALATDPVTGGYWILKSDGGVANYNAPWYGSMTGIIPPGQTVTAIAPSRGGYLILTSNGGVHNFGAPWWGSAAGTLGAGVTAIGLAVDPATGGYWILMSSGRLVACNAPFDGSMKGIIPPGTTLTGISASPRGGYLILSSNGGVHNFDTPWYGSAAGTLPDGVTAIGLADEPATGGYVILKSDGGVANYHTPWRGSMTGIIPPGQSVTALGPE